MYLILKLQLTPLLDNAVKMTSKRRSFILLIFIIECILKSHIWFGYLFFLTQISERHQVALEIITYIGCGLSLVGETLTILTYLVLM